MGACREGAPRNQGGVWACLEYKTVQSSPPPNAGRLHKKYHINSPSDAKKTIFWFSR